MRKHQNNRAKSYLVLPSAGAFLILAILGCGKSGYYPVSGHVTTGDGEALVAAHLLFRSEENKTCRAITNEKGYYEIGVIESGEGAPPGTYRVSIMEDTGDPEKPKPQQIHVKYASANQSGLVFKIPDDGDTFDMMLDPPAQRGRK